MNDYAPDEARDLDRVVRVVDAEELTLDFLSAFLVDNDRPAYSRVAGDAGVSVAMYRRLREGSASMRLDADDEEGVTADRDVVAARPKPPPWRIAFTRRFDKDIAQLDRKMQGQILETLRKLSSFAWPFQIQGDTFKPLSGDLKGMWRYRLGDFRLVVKPVLVDSELDLVTFAARGSVYD